MILCFGSFARVLNYCRQKGDTNPHFIWALVKVVDSSCPEPVEVTNILNCKNNLSRGNFSGAVEKSKNPEIFNKKLQVVNSFKQTILPIIDQLKIKQVILALLDIIDKDETLSEEQKYCFVKYIGTTKENLLIQTKFNAPELLSDILLYTLASVENTRGKEYIQQITKEYVVSFDSQEFIWHSKSSSLKKLSVLIPEALEATYVELCMEHDLSRDEIRSWERNYVERMYHLFIDIVKQYNVMSIINNTTAIIIREDSALLNNFLEHINREILEPYRKQYGSILLYQNIAIFWEKLILQTMSIDAMLNRRFGSENDSAEINMSDIDNSPTPKTKSKQIVLPSTQDLIDSGEVSSQNLLRFRSEDERGWGNFRTEMNILYKQISTETPE